MLTLLLEEFTVYLSKGELTDFFGLYLNGLENENIIPLLPLMKSGDTIESLSFTAKIKVFLRQKNMLLAVSRNSQKR